MLQYLVKLVNVTDPDLLKVQEELLSIGPAKKVVLESVASQLTELGDQLARVNKNIAAMDSATKSQYEISAEHVRNLTAMNEFSLRAEKLTNEANIRIMRCKLILKSSEGTLVKIKK